MEADFTKPDARTMCVLLATGMFDALSEYGLETKEDAWDLLDDHQRVVVLAEQPMLWLEGFEHARTGVQLENVPGVPSGWTTYLWADNGNVGAFFRHVDGSFEDAVQCESRRLLKSLNYEQYLTEPERVASDLWRWVASRRRAA